MGTLIDALANVSDDELERPKPRGLPRAQRTERTRNDAGERV